MPENKFFIETIDENMELTATLLEKIFDSDWAQIFGKKVTLLNSAVGITDAIHHGKYDELIDDFLGLITLIPSPITKVISWASIITGFVDAIHVAGTDNRQKVGVKNLEDHIGDLTLYNTTKEELYNSMVKELANFSADTLELSDEADRAIQEMANFGFGNFEKYEKELSAVKPYMEGLNINALDAIDKERGGGGGMEEIQNVFKRQANLVKEEMGFYIDLLSQDTVDAINTLLIEMQPSAEQWEALAAMYTAQGKQVPESIRKGLSDYNELMMLMGDQEALYYYWGEQMVSSPERFELLDLSMLCGKDVPEALRQGLLNNSSFVVDEAENLIMKTKGGLEKNLGVVTPELQSMMKGLGVDLWTSIEDGVEAGAQGAQPVDASKYPVDISKYFDPATNTMKVNNPASMEWQNLVPKSTNKTGTKLTSILSDTFAAIIQDAKITFDSAQWQSYAERAAAALSYGFTKYKIQGNISFTFAGFGLTLYERQLLQMLGLSGIPSIYFRRVVQQYALGGFPTMGEMFIARERGPEMVGRIGSRTAVANNDQIVEGISAGVYNAVSNAMRNGDGRDLNITVVSRIGDEDIGKSYVRYHNGVLRKTGTSPLSI